jgi:ubiquinone/menaquinone biosynthesis C-methylase UbiE
MIEQATLLRREKNLCNVKYEIGDVTHLPYSDASFSIIVTRYSLHHLVDPYSVLTQMKRVCISKGQVIVIDATPPSDNADTYNYMEKLRDPSHVRALTLTELHEMIKQKI